MNAEQVVEKILSQARSEAETIASEAKEKAAAANSQLESELAEFDKKTDESAKAAGEDRYQRMLAAARMNNARRMLAERVAILDEIFDGAKKAVNALPDDAWQALMMTLMKKAVQGGDEEVIIGKDEPRINPEFIERVNRQLGPGFQGNLRLSSQRGDFSGGFILSRGKVQLNAGIDVMIDRLRETMEMELAKELFG